MNSGIYSIRNMKNGKWYIGGTTNLKKRKRIHFAELKHGNHQNKYLQADYIKDGISNFEFIILEYVAENNLNKNERYWIIFYKANWITYGYNTLRGGGGGGRRKRDNIFTNRQRFIRTKYMFNRKRNSYLRK